MNEFLPAGDGVGLCDERFFFSEVQFIFPGVGLGGVHFILQGLQLFLRSRKFISYGAQRNWSPKI